MNCLILVTFCVAISTLHSFPTSVITKWGRSLKDAHSSWMHSLWSALQQLFCQFYIVISLFLVSNCSQICEKMCHSCSCSCYLSVKLISAPVEKLDGISRWCVVIIIVMEDDRLNHWDFQKPKIWAVLLIFKLCLVIILDLFWLVWLLAIIS